jgi:hypothetical protein
MSYMETDMGTLKPEKFSRPSVQDEAVLVTLQNFLKVATWCGGQAKTSGRIVLSNWGEPLEAWLGDWLVKVPTGEFYVMSDAEFRSCHVNVV